MIMTSKTQSSQVMRRAPKMVVPSDEVLSVSDIEEIATLIAEWVFRDLKRRSTRLEMKRDPKKKETKQKETKSD